MAYTFSPLTHLSGQFNGHNGKTYNVEIYHSETTPGQRDIDHFLADGITLEWEGGDAEDPLYPIVSSSLELSFVVQDEAVLSDIKAFASADPEATVVKMSEEGGDWVWYGHILPEEVEYVIADGQVEVVMAFADGLAMLKDYDFKVDTDDFHTRADEEVGESYKSGRTGLGMVNNILSKITWYKEFVLDAGGAVNCIRETPYLQHNSLTATGVQPILSNTGFNPAAFTENKEKQRKGRAKSAPEFDNCYDVLGDIISTLGSKVCWNGYEWHVYSPLAFAMDSSFGDTTDGTIGTDTAASFVVTAADLTTAPGGHFDPTADNITALDFDTNFALKEGATVQYSTGNRRLLAIHEGGGIAPLMKYRPSQVFPYRMADLNPTFEEATTLKSSSALEVLTTDNTYTLNFKGTIHSDSSNLEFESNAAIGLLALRFKAGTEDTDGYILRSNIAKATDTVTYRHNGTATAETQYVLDYPFNAVEWVANTGNNTYGNNFNDGGFVYIPIYTTEADFDGNRIPAFSDASTTYYGTPRQKLNDSNDQFRRRASFNGEYTFSISEAIPALPANVTGYEIEVGLVYINGDTSAVDATAVIADTLTDEYASALGSDVFDVIANSTSGPKVTQLSVRSANLVIDGDNASADRELYANLGTYDELELVSTRIAGNSLGNGGANSIATHDTWAEAPAGAWTTSAYWDNIEGEYSADNHYNNLSVILKDTNRLFKGKGYRTVEANLAPRLGGTWDIITPDMALFSDCITNAYTMVSADSMTWSSTTGQTMSGIIYDQTREVVEAVEDTPRGDSPVITGGSPIGVKPAVSSGEVDLSGYATTTDLDGYVGKPTTYTAGDLIKLDANGDAVVDNEIPLTKLEDIGSASVKSLQYSPVTNKWVAVDPADATDLASASLGDLGDVTMGTGADAPASNDFLRYNGVVWENSSINLGMLTNVSTSLPSSNDILQYDGSEWVPTDLSTSIPTLGSIGNVSPNPDTDDVLQYNGTTWLHQSVGTVLGNGNLDDLGDVDTSGVSNADILQYNNGTWEVASIGTAIASAIDLDDLSNVDTTGKATDAVLQWDGNDWVDKTPAQLANTLSILDLSDVDYTTAPATNDILKWDGNKFIHVPETAAVLAIDDITDVSIGNAASRDQYDLIEWDGTSNYVGVSADDFKRRIAIEDLKDFEFAGSPGDGDTIEWDGSEWTFAANSGSGGATELNGLSDVDTTGLTTNDILQYNGTNWVPVSNSATVASLADIGDVDITTTPSNLSFLTYNDNGAGDDKWEDRSLASTVTLLTSNGVATSAQGALADTATQPGDNVSDLTNDAGYLTGLVTQSIDDLGDVNINTPSDGQVITWNNTFSEWENVTLDHDSISDFDTEVDARIGAANLDDLNDVNYGVITPTTGHILYNNAGVWVPVTGTDLYATAAQGTLAVSALQAGDNISDLTNDSGYITDYTVVEGDVTAHEAALAIDYSQLTSVPSTFTPDAHTHVLADITDTASLTLDYVTDNGATTTNDITTGDITVEDTSAEASLTISGTASGGDAATLKFDQDPTTDTDNNVSLQYNVGGTFRNFLQVEGIDSGDFVNVGPYHGGGGTKITSTKNAGAYYTNIETAWTGTKVMFPSVTNQAGTTLYTLPTADGTSGQVIQTDGSGNLSFATPSGGSSNPIYHFDQTCYNSVTTSTGLYFWLPGSATYGFEFYDNNETSALTTSATWNRYKKMSHRLKSGTYDLSFFVDISMSTTSNGTSHNSDYAEEDVEVYFYKVGRSGSNGDVTFTQIGTTQYNTQNSTDTAVGTETSYSTSGVSFDGEERIMVVLKGTVNLGGTRYCHWAYDIEAEKTA